MLTEKDPGSEGNGTNSSSSEQRQMNGEKTGEKAMQKDGCLNGELISSGFGVAKKRQRPCCDHRHKLKKAMKVSVACQTDESGFEGCSTASSSQCAPIPICTTSPKKEDGTKSEGTLRLMIQNFRNMSDTVRGPGKVVTGVPWKIMVMPRQHVVAKKGTQKCLGFFLQCCPDSYSDSWSCQASAELRLISQKPGVPNFVRKTNHVYTAKENDWGYSCFMTWADILEESQGYMKDEKVILEVFVKAEPPKGILTHDAFCKKILDYMRLAEMQSSRGLIDKAIEVNQTALKFCKDKDDNMKEELEKQKHQLIEMKLKQSIERIEKGTNNSSEFGEDGTKLRHALTGNWLKRSAPSGSGNNGHQKTSPSGGKQKNEDENSLPWPKTKQTEEGGKEKEEEMNGIPDLDDEVEEKEEIGKVEDLEDSQEWDEGVVGDDEDTGPCSSGEDEDDSYSEELCDSCLQEKLESCFGSDEVQTADTSCQTDVASAPVGNQVRLPPVGAPAPTELCNSNRNTLSEEEARRSLISAASKWTPEKEAELLDLITQESRASLDTIRDTLERLVSLAQDGEVPPGLEFDLAALRAEQQQRAVANTDIVELPPVDGSNSEEEKQEPPPPPPPAKKNSERQQHQQQLNKLLLKQQEQQRMLAAQQMQLEKIKEKKVQQEIQEFTEEEYNLIQHAKEIVEMKAEELVTKYSQLIEQSEATRLAETVKKVEKRMKDIEKQTMTCRKELADECERHHREEQRLIKANKQLRSQLDQATEKAEKLNVQLKDRKAEVKKLEKKLKAESQMSVENAELLNKIDVLEKELGASQKKQGEEVKKLQKETQSFTEVKKQLQQELTSAGGEIERLNTQLEEKTAAVKKMEQKIEQERRQTQASLKESVERAKKAEMNLLEFKLEMGAKVLQRAQEDCQTNIKHLDEMMKRCGKNQAYENFMIEWQKTKDKIADMISKTKKDFTNQIEAVKSGKALASLPVLEVPKPPPPPQLKSIPPPITQQQQSFEQPKQPIAPIGARPSAGGASMPPAVSVVSQQPISGGATESPTTMPSPVPASVAPHINGSAAPATPVSASITSSFNGAASSHSHPYPLQNNGFINVPAPSTQQSQVVESSGMKTPPLAVEQHLTNGFSPWSDPLSILQDYFFASPARQASGSNAGGMDGWHAGLVNQGVVGSAGPYQQMSAPIQPHQVPYSTFAPPGPAPTPLGSGQNSCAGSAGRWGVGWGYQQVMNAGPAQSPVPDKNFGMRPLSRETSSPGAQGMIDSRGSSPITALNERHKRVDTLMEQLRATFPSYPPDFLRDYVNEFRSQQPGKTLKGLSVEQALNGVVSLLLSKNPVNANWGGEGNFQPVLQTMNLDTFAGSVSASGDGCGLCGESLRNQQKTTSLKCCHRFHQKCVKDWLTSQPTCPACGRYNPSPEEYPELS